MMIDIHCHILPGVDDGAGNTSDAVQMAELAASSGIRTMIATPHCNIPGIYSNLWGTDLERRFLTLHQELRRRRIPLTLLPGQELFLAENYLSLLRSGQIITLNRSRYLLVEFSFEETFAQAHYKLGRIAAEGYIPIVAHPERYRFVQETPESIYRLRETGALFQLNKGSLKGSFGNRAFRAADRIMRHHLADLVASDAHSQFRRTPCLADIHELICEQYSADYADLLLQTNPVKVINNQSI